MMFAMGRRQGAVQGTVQDTPDHVCHWAVSVQGAFGVLRIIFAIGWCQGAVQGAPESSLPLGGVRVLSAPRIMCSIGRYLCRVLSRVLWIMFAIGRCQGAIQGVPESFLPLGGVRVLLSTSDYIFHWAVSVQGIVQGTPDYGIMFAIGQEQGAVQGALNHVCDWVVSELSRVLSKLLSRVPWIMSGCCPGCSGLCLLLGGVRILSRVLRIMFAIGRCQGVV